VRWLTGNGLLRGVAARTSPCAACGTVLYEERTFTGPDLSGYPSGPRIALSELHGQVQQWRKQPITCWVCPERIATGAP
jgi:hypothetical protein